jgi:hypothetical protein
MKSLRSFLLATLLVLGLTTTAQACPGCKEALASNDGVQGDIVSGYFWSILFMMSMPFTILGMFGIVVYRAMKKAQLVERPVANEVSPHLDAGVPVGQASATPFNMH